MKYKIEFENIPWESPAKGIKFKRYIQNNRAIRLVEFSNDFIESDWCSKGHIGYILNGQVEIDFNGNKIVFGPGDGLFIPEGTENKHKAKIISEKVITILIEDL